MEILKGTRTFSPNTSHKANAKIFTDCNYVFLQPDGFNKKTIIEKDPELYKILMHKDKKLRPSQISHLVIEPTYRCNLNCPTCFTDGQEEEITLDEIKEEISRYKNKIVSISGGEPTMRTDLIDIIRVVAKRNIPLLATNGLKLTDYNYVAELKQAGLNHVTFSFNGFSDMAYIKTNGRPLLKEKMKAIDNLLRLDMKFLLSVMLEKGVNEKDIKPIINLAKKHIKNIKEVRFRAVAPVGKHCEVYPFYASEILESICSEMQFLKEDIYRELRLRKMLLHRLPFLNFTDKSCSFSFYLGNFRRNLFPVGKYLNNKYYSINYAYFSTKMYLNYLFNKKSIWHHNASLLKISVRVWPNINTLDFHDHFDRCNSRYLTGNKKNIPVCYANILHDMEAIK